MSGTDLLFWLLAVVSIAAAWRVFRTPSMVRATFLLLLSFCAVGGVLLLLGAPYLGTATVFMMAAEMMVMVVFMVMFMMNPAGLNPMNMVHQPRLAAAAGAAVFLALAAAVLLTDFPARPLLAGAPVVRDLGLALMGDDMLLFEAAGVTLLATMIGTVVLSSRSGRYGAADEGSVPPGLEPGGAPAGPAPARRTGHAAMHGAHGMHAGHDMHQGHDMRHGHMGSQAHGGHDGHGKGDA